VCDKRGVCRQQAMMKQIFEAFGFACRVGCMVPCTDMRHPYHTCGVDVKGGGGAWYPAPTGALACQN
jgi:hypothetical protein